AARVEAARRRAEAARVEAARAEAVRAAVARTEPDLLEDHAVLQDPALHAERTLTEERGRPHPAAAERPPAAYVLGVAGGAALALTLGGVLFLALPSDYTALTVLLVGVIAWTTVVLLSLRLPSRR
ncbi:MAG TPA: hypothetical protein VLM05_12930, partial [Mycobacteriales bacterium]|nr:hypothetical protein [Mycobacteriales bacterium]